MTEMLAAWGRFFIIETPAAGLQPARPARRRTLRPMWRLRDRRAVSTFDRLPDPRDHLSFWIRSV